MTERPLLRVSATRLRASASSDAAMKDVNLAETNSEAEMYLMLPSSSLSDMVMQLMPVLMVDLSPTVAATGMLLDASDA